MPDLQMFYSYAGCLCVNKQSHEKKGFICYESHLNKIKNGHIVSFKSMISIWAEWKLSKHVLV